MKEMCRNFVCSNSNCEQAAATKSMAMENPDVSVGDCSSCVMKRIGLAQAYIPSQPYTMPMGQEQSLVCGTVFTELVMPYCSGWNLERFGREA